MAAKVMNINLANAHPLKANQVVFPDVIHNSLHAEANEKNTNIEGVDINTFFQDFAVLLEDYDFLGLMSDKPSLDINYEAEEISFDINKGSLKRPFSTNSSADATGTVASVRERERKRRRQNAEQADSSILIPEFQSLPDVDENIFDLPLLEGQESLAELLFGEFEKQEKNEPEVEPETRSHLLNPKNYLQKSSSSSQAGSRKPKVFLDYTDTRSSEWRKEDIILLLQCTKLLVQFELKTITKAFSLCLEKESNASRGRAAEKKLKRMGIFSTWKSRDQSAVMKGIDAKLKELGAKERKVNPKLLWIAENIKKEMDK